MNVYFHYIAFQSYTVCSIKSNIWTVLGNSFIIYWFCNFKCSLDNNLSKNNINFIVQLNNIFALYLFNPAKQWDMKIAWPDPHISHQEMQNNCLTLCPFICLLSVCHLTPCELLDGFRPKFAHLVWNGSVVGFNQSINYRHTNPIRDGH